MKVYKEVDCLEEFEAWAGGLQRKNDAIKAGKAAEVWEFIEEATEGAASEGEINELLWFDDTINDMIYNDEDNESENI